MNHSLTGSTTVSACDSYTWTQNANTTYTVNGNYVHTFTSAQGCDSVHTLHLTVRYSNTGATTATTCDSYTWTQNSNAVYTVSGNYTQTFMNSSGCDSVHTLHLTVNYSGTSSTSATACDSYTWSCNSMTYTSSGTYTCTSSTTQGCTLITTLHLTVNHSLTGSTTVSACDSYTWTQNANTTYTVSGNYVHTFTSAQGCDSVHTLHLTIRHSISQVITVDANVFYTWDANNTTYTVSGTYTNTQTNAAGCDSSLTLQLTIHQGVLLSAKAILEGPYNSNTGLMYDSLRVLGQIPATEPYTSTPYSKIAIGGPSGETVSNAVLSVQGNNAIVDWVYLELRDASNSGTIVATKRALIQRDGDIVSAVDGVSPVYFPNRPAGSYYVTVKHRNHLGIMTSAALSFNFTSVTTVDMTLATGIYNNILITNVPRKQFGTVYAMWSADANNNKNVKYNGLSNDKDVILNALGVANSNSILYPVYRMEDVNMDGKIRYNGLDNDRDLIISNIGVNTPNNILFQHTPN